MTWHIQFEYRIVQNSIVDMFKNDIWTASAEKVNGGRENATVWGDKMKNLCNLRSVCLASRAEREYHRDRICCSFHHFALRIYNVIIFPPRARMTRDTIFIFVLFVALNRFDALLPLIFFFVRGDWSWIINQDANNSFFYFVFFIFLLLLRFFSCAIFS